jgi:hypothetical protein
MWSFIHSDHSDGITKFRYSTPCRPKLASGSLYSLLLMKIENILQGFLPNQQGKRRETQKNFQQ